MGKKLTKLKNKIKHNTSQYLKKGSITGKLPIQINSKQTPTKIQNQDACHGLKWPLRIKKPLHNLGK